MNIRLFLLIVFLLSGGINTSIAQEHLGLRTENYAGVNGILLNPASNLTSPYRFDVNLFSGGFFAENNYGHIRNTHLFHIIKNSSDPDNIFNGVYSRTDIPTEDSWLVYDFFDNEKRKYASASFHALGPSFTIKINNGHSFSLITGLRGMGSTHRVPFEAAFYYIDRIPFREAIDIDPINAAGMVWGEVGLNYAAAIQTYQGRLGFGITAKYLTGFEAGFTSSPQTLQITQFPDDTLTLQNGVLDFGFTDSNTNTAVDPGVSQNGKGIGIDIGAVMTIEGDAEPYQWRFGASILDIGKVNFNNNAQLHQIIQPRDTVLGIGTLPLNDFGGREDLTEYVQLLSEYTLQDSFASFVGNSFAIGLPTAISLQADYQFQSGFFVNAMWMQRLKFNPQTIGRDNLFVLSSRYEHRWLSGSLSLVLRNYQKLRLGFSARLAFFVIGTENLGSWIGRSTFTGTDIYFGIKINPFRTGPWEFGGGKGKGVKCYDF